MCSLLKQVGKLSLGSYSFALQLLCDSIDHFTIAYDNNIAYFLTSPCSLSMPFVFVCVELRMGIYSYSRQIQIRYCQVEHFISAMTVEHFTSAMTVEHLTSAMTVENLT